MSYKINFRFSQFAIDLGETRMLTIITYGPRRFVYKSNANQNIYIYTHTLDAVLYFKQSYSLKLKFKILLLNVIS